MSQKVNDRLREVMDSSAAAGVRQGSVIAERIGSFRWPDHPALLLRQTPVAVGSCHPG